MNKKITGLVLMLIALSSLTGCSILATATDATHKDIPQTGALREDCIDELGKPVATRFENGKPVADIFAFTQGLAAKSKFKKASVSAMGAVMTFGLSEFLYLIDQNDRYKYWEGHDEFVEAVYNENGVIQKIHHVDPYDAQKACEMKYGTSCFDLGEKFAGRNSTVAGEYYIRGCDFGVEESCPKSIDAREKHCNAGDVGACRKLAYFYWQGKYVGGDKKKAGAYFVKSFDVQYENTRRQLQGLYP